MASGSMSDYFTPEVIKELQETLLKHPIDHSYDEECEAYDNDVPPEQLASRCAYDALKGIGKLPPGHRIILTTIHPDGGFLLPIFTERNEP